MLVLSGDFNAHHPILEPWGGGVSNSRGRHLVQMMEDFEELQLHGAASPTHIGCGRLDLTLTVNDSDCVQNVNGIPELLSDHWAQEYDIHLPRTTHQPNIMRTRWLTRKADWIKFTHHLNTWYASCVPSTSVQSFADDLTNAIQGVADASMPRKGKTKFNPNKKHLWYYDDRVKFLHRVSRQLTNTYKFTRTIEDKRNMVEWATYAREHIKASIREEKWLRTMGRLKHDTSMTQEWRLVNRVRGKHTQPPRHPDPAGKAAELMREYHERALDDSLPENIKEAKDNLDPTREAGVAEAARLADDTDAPITREELFRARKTSRDTAPGQDGITYSMLNAVCHVAGDPLVHLYNMSLSQGTLPEAWKTANIVPIPKPGEGNKFRPVSLTSVLCKMLERILLTRLNYKIGRLHPGVNGFVKHRSTANCLSNYFSYHHAKTAVFLDIEKAFDRA